MIGSTRNVRVWAYPKPCDLRKGHHGLSGLVHAEFDAALLSGDYFVFVNRRRTLCKVLFWDGTGLCIYNKRLEEGRFPKLWRRPDEPKLRLTVSELALFLEGCEMVGKEPLSPAEFRLDPEIVV